MADVIGKLLANETSENIVNETLINNATNTTGARIPATPEGAAVAYCSIILMAVLPIFFGAFRSVKHHKEQKASGEKPDTMSSKDAAMFPIIASCALFGLYVFFQVFSKEYINMLLTGYFFFLGVVALAHILDPFFVKIVPASVPNTDYHLLFTQGKQKKEDIINYKFNTHDLICLGFCSLIGLWYLWKKHWIANNLFGVAFAINGIELLLLNNVVTGCILLGGLFFYDIFWVFGTNVMVTVAKSFEAPIKLVFPQDLLEKGFEANNFAMLGLGDIVIPGIFIALLLRYDMSTKKKSRTYFTAGYVAYILGLVATIVVMHFFKHAQPALLYLVPCCLGFPLLLALIKGEIKPLLKYEDSPPTKEEKKNNAKKEGGGGGGGKSAKNAAPTKKEK